MQKRIDFFYYLRESKDANSLYLDAYKRYQELLVSELQHLHIDKYRYSPKEAVEELGLDEELVSQLVNDFVVQVIHSIAQFEEYLKNLQNSYDKEEVLDYTPFRELAHKNLGVARNLRIKDAQVLLNELMKADNLSYLFICLEAVKLSVICLNAKCAYNTIKRINEKSKL
jgi:HPt (histidine-containing phosphotransfer) domain-containing protein